MFSTLNIFFHCIYRGTCWLCIKIAVCYIALKNWGASKPLNDLLISNYNSKLCLHIIRWSFYCDLACSSQLKNHFPIVKQNEARESSWRHEQTRRRNWFAIRIYYGLWQIDLGWKSNRQSVLQPFLVLASLSVQYSKGLLSLKNQSWDCSICFFLSSADWDGALNLYHFCLICVRSESTAGWTEQLFDMQINHSSRYCLAKPSLWRGNIV